MRARSRGSHAAKKPGAPWRRPEVLVAGAVVVLVAGGSGVALAVKSKPSAAAAHARMVAEAQAHEAALAAAQQRLLSTVAVSPTDGATAVPLDQVVTLTATVAEPVDVRVTTSSGTPAEQRSVDLSPSGPPQPISSGPLAPSTTYHVTVDVHGDGVDAERTFSFTTLTPSAMVSATVFPSAGMIVGVGQAIVIHFNHSVTSDSARRAIEGRLTVAMSQPVPGGWYWFSPTELHFRPQSYWAAHQQVAISGDLSGLDLGDGRWAEGKISDSFSIGDARISYANLETERMVVTLDGHTVYSFPISGGRPQYPTMNGDHVVLDRESVVHMVSSTVGIPVKSPNGYDEYVYDDVHISDSGEYVHAAPWSVGSQGRTNVSHGCINISPSNAKTFFDFSRVGDVVEVTGSPRPAVTGDHGVMDWSTPWSSWTPANVVPLGGAPATTTTSLPSPTSTDQAPTTG